LGTGGKNRLHAKIEGGVIGGELAIKRRQGGRSWVMGGGEGVGSRQNSVDGSRGRLKNGNRKGFPEKLTQEKISRKRGLESKKCPKTENWGWRERMAYTRGGRLKIQEFTSVVF